MNSLAEKYGDKLGILGFPCNQFGHQTNEGDVRSHSRSHTHCFALDDPTVPRPRSDSRKKTISVLLPSLVGRVPQHAQVRSAWK